MPGPGGLRGLHSWVPWGCNNCRDSADRLSFPAHCADSRLKLIPSFSEQEAYLFVQELWPEGQASGLHTYRSSWRCPQGTEASGHKLCPLPLPRSSLLVSSRKKFIPLPVVLIFVASARGHLYIAWFSRPVQLLFALGPRAAAMIS